MSKPLAITKEVLISQGQVWVNNEVVFERPGMELKDLLRTCYQQLGVEYPKFFKMDLLCQLAFIGSEVLLKDLDLTARHTKENIAVVLSNAAASLDTDRRYHDTIKNTDAYFPSPAVFVYTLPSIMCGEIAIRNGFMGENNFLITDSFNEPLLETHIATLFAQTNTQACLSGWVQVDGSEYELVMYVVERLR